MGYSDEIKAIYGNKIRIRVCGILENEEKYLFVNHKNLNAENIFWNFPGGGIEEGESIKDALKREFSEEVNLDISLKHFCFLNQVIEQPLHAIELYFGVTSEHFRAQMGQDPEFNIISDLKWMSSEEFLGLPVHQKPTFFLNIKSINDLIYPFQS